MIKMNEETLKQIIINTIKGEEHLGENLKEQCVDYIEQLQNNWNELKKWLEEESNNTIYATGHLTAICMTLNKMQELQGDDKN